MELIDREKEEMDIKMLSPLTWAYVGDSVYELYVRTYLINKTKLKMLKTRKIKIKIQTRLCCFSKSGVIIFILQLKGRQFPCIF